MLKTMRFLAPAAALGGVFTARDALAGQGLPKPWQMWFQEPASPVMERIMEFHDLVFAIEVAIVLLVLGIMAYIVVRFNHKANPAPSKNTHNTLLEVIWTVIPIVILVVIAVPSFKLLYFADKIEKADMTLKVIGNQWFWSYTYPDQGDIQFDSIIVAAEDLKPGQPRLLTVDNKVVLPVDTNIRLLFTSNDVIHNWAVPAFGLKLDASPGRINESWVRITSEGDYFGMCSELCGVNHAFMPVHVQAVSKAKFAEWAAAQKKAAAGGRNDKIKVVQAEKPAR
ncbi:MAG: cytochrome c oxidase subunit II [Rhodospirillales bacterium]|nr:cytochrome c oxidase subunit II [Rhodospirillales bacterium]